MKKNITIGLLALTTILSASFGYLQKKQADEQTRIAIEMSEKVSALQKIVEENQKVAEANYRKALQEYERTAQLVVETKKNESKK